jgi:hypothetical protein
MEAATWLGQLQYVCSRSLSWLKAECCELPDAEKQLDVASPSAGPGVSIARMCLRRYFVWFISNTTSAS